MNYRKPTNLTSYYRAIFKLGLPIMLGQLGVIVVGFVDNIMVGHHSTPELAAASFVNNFMNLAFIPGVGFAYGLTPLVASAFSAPDGKVLSLLRSSLVANLIVGVLFTLIMWILWLNLDKLGQPDELMQYIRPYFMIQLVSIIITMLFNAYKQFADGTDRAIVAMVVMILSNVLNVIFNYLLIFGKFGFPEWGLIGAGVSTLMARVFCLVVLWYLVEHHRSFKVIFEKLNDHKGRVERAHLKELFKLGLPMCLQMGVEAASFSLAVIMVGWLGSMELAAHQIITIVSTLGFLFYTGMANAVTIHISRYRRMKDIPGIHATSRAGLSLLWMMAVGFIIFLLIFRDTIGFIFTNDTRLVEMVSMLCVPVMIYQFGDALQIHFANVLRGLQDVRYLAICAVICHIFLALTLVYLFAFTFGWGVVGVWYAFPVSLTSLGLLLYLRYRKIVPKEATERKEK